MSTATTATTTTATAADDPFLARFLALRNVVVELAPAANGQPARTVTLRRPPEAQIMAMMQAGVRPADVCTAAVDWAGWTEATLFGGAVGGPAVVPFSPALWEAWVMDHAEELSTCIQRLADAITAHLAQRTADRKN